MPIHHHPLETMLLQDLSTKKPAVQIHDDSTSSFNVHELPCSSKTRTDDEVDTRATSTTSISSLDEIVPTAPSTQKAKKSVSFCDTVKFREIRHNKDMSNAERARLWYTVAALLEIKREVQQIVGHMNSGIDLSSDLGQRGVAHFCKPEKQARSKRRFEVYSSVYLMQELQEDLWSIYEDGGNITEVIGQQYARLSEESKAEALLRAMNDHAEALIEPIEQKC